MREPILTPKEIAAFIAAERPDELEIRAMLTALVHSVSTFTALVSTAAAPPEKDFDDWFHKLWMSTLGPSSAPGLAELKNTLWLAIRERELSLFKAQRGLALTDGSGVR